MCLRWERALYLVKAMKKIWVNLDDRSYPLVIGDGDFGRLIEEAGLRKTPGLQEMVVVADEMVWNHYAGQLDQALNHAPRFVVPSGEKAKCLQQVEQLLEFLADAKMDRRAVLVSVGGGVTGDLAGFVAACYLRGIRFFQIPTTLLAMVDSSVGGKTGVNLRAGKNLAGAFHQPVGVAIWLPFLQSLPGREFVAGMAEVVKYGCLGDSTLFRLIEHTGRILPTDPLLPDIIQRCCEIKGQIVASDEREQADNGGRALLNLGHTFAHALEKVAGWGSYLHGEAVFIGLVLGARLSAELGLLPENEVARILQVIERQGGPTRLREPLSSQALVDAMYNDKKMRLGELRMIALKSVGEAVVIKAPPEEVLAKLWLGAGAV